MSQYGPGDKPKVVRKRAARARRQQQVQQQTANAAPLSSTPVKPKTVRQVQRATQRAAQQARPLSQTPGKPRPVRPPTQARPLASQPPQGVRAGKPVTDVKQRRAVAVAAYKQLSGDAKRGHLAGARKRVQQGKATEADVAILHHHSTSVQGNRKRVEAVRAFNALAGEQIGGKTAHIEIAPGTTVRGGYVYDPSGKRLHKVETVSKANVGSVANLPSVGKIAATLGPIATKGLSRTSLPKFIKNIPKDAGELAVTSPTAVVKSISTAVSHPKQEAKALAGQYGELAKHPKKFISDKPVTAALMLNPLARAPGLAAGKVLRTAGKQTLRREAATLPGTALREERTGSRAAGRRVVQAAKDKRAAAKGRQPQVTARQLDQRVDARERASEGQPGARRHPRERPVGGEGRGEGPDSAVICPRVRSDRNA
jgi:hypothetical protein